MRLFVIIILAISMLIMSIILFNHESYLIVDKKDEFYDFLTQYYITAINGIEMDSLPTVAKENHKKLSLEWESQSDNQYFSINKITKKLPITHDNGILSLNIEFEYTYVQLDDNNVVFEQVGIQNLQIFYKNKKEFLIVN